VRVSHASHGLGEIKDTARNDDDKQCWDVVFDSGDRRYYPQANGPQKLVAVVQDMTSSQPKVTLRVFRLAVLQCIPHALPCVIEALYVLLQVLDAGEEVLQFPTDVGVSIDLVTAASSAKAARSFNSIKRSGLCRLLQVSEVVGMVPSTKTLSWIPDHRHVMAKSASMFWSLSARLVRLLGAKLPSSRKRVGAHLPDSSWSAMRVEVPVRSLCCDIGGTVSPVVLRHWVNTYNADEDQMAQLFVLAARLKPHICDASDIGIYSKTSKAKVYRGVAERMPKLLVLAGLSQGMLARHLELFMRAWKDAEEDFPEERLAILHGLDGRDHGPFLYWMLNERCQVFCTSRLVSPFLCACMNGGRGCTSLRFAPLRAALHYVALLCSAPLCFVSRGLELDAVWNPLCSMLHRHRGSGSARSWRK
jgi:hypothetical protein